LNHKNTQTMENTIIPFDLSKRVTSNLFSGYGTLTGKYDMQDWCGEQIMMVEVDTDFSKSFFFIDYLSQN